MKFEGFSTERSSPVEIITTGADTLPKDVLETHSARLISRGGHFSVNELIPVYFAALIGCPNKDADTYNNMLFTLRDDLIKSPKLLIYIDKELRNPEPDEVTAFKTVNRTDKKQMVSALTALVNIPSDNLRTELARKELYALLVGMMEETPGKLFNTGAKIITWLNRICTTQGFINKSDEIPLLFYYGNITPTEVTFLHFISKIGIDVLYICSNTANAEIINAGNLDNRMQVFVLPGTMAVQPFPQKLVKAKVATVAYSAERELDTMLYGDNTIFRAFQFSDMQSMTLKTTYEEIDILWHQDVKYRSGFEIRDNKVIVPNIFAKISGVKDGNMGDYWDEIRSKLTPDTIIVNKAPAYKKAESSSLLAYKPYYSGTTIFIEQLMASPLNNYHYLSDKLQYLIFNKMQEAVDSRFLKLEQDELVSQIIYVGLNLDKEIIRKLQKFDFTKATPKYIVIDAIEDTFSKIECIQLVLYNILGFDILIYTPTGYKNLETFVNDRAFEIYTMNEFKYNVTIPKFKIPTAVQSNNNSGLFNKLFKKGRK
jgi:hypothetical protein